MSTSTDSARLFTAGELAEHYSLSRATIYNLMDRGMPSVKIGRSRRFRLAAVDQWLEAQQAPATLQEAS